MFGTRWQLPIRSCCDNSGLAQTADLRRCPPFALGPRTPHRMRWARTSRPPVVRKLPGGGGTPSQLVGPLAVDDARPILFHQSVLGGWRQPQLSLELDFPKRSTAANVHASGLQLRRCVLPSSSVHVSFAFPAHHRVMTTATDLDRVADPARWSEQAGPSRSPARAAGHAQELLARRCSHVRTPRESRTAPGGHPRHPARRPGSVGHRRVPAPHRRRRPVATTGFHRSASGHLGRRLVGNHTGTHIEADQRPTTEGQP